MQSSSWTSKLHGKSESAVRTKLLMTACLVGKVEITASSRFREPYADSFLEMRRASPPRSFKSDAPVLGVNPARSPHCGPVCGRLRHRCARVRRRRVVRPIPKESEGSKPLAGQATLSNFNQAKTTGRSHLLPIERSGHLGRAKEPEHERVDPHLQQSVDHQREPMWKGRTSSGRAVPDVGPAVAFFSGSTFVGH